MKKKISALLVILFISMACNFLVSDVFRNGGGNADEGFYDEVEYSRSLTATLFALETAIAEATATSSAESGQFCTIYEELVAHSVARVADYESVLTAGGDAHSIAVEMDHSLEAYMDRLAPSAPPKIRTQVEALAGMSLIGVFSSNEGVPASEPLLKDVDNYAALHCADSFSDH